MDKIIILGTFGAEQSRKIGRYYSALHLKVCIEIEEKEDGKRRLSISGDTYRPGARDIESGGQILEDVRRLLNDKTATLNKPRAVIERLLEVWDRWHLNDMRAGCKHQRATWNPLEEIVLVQYILKS